MSSRKILVAALSVSLLLGSSLLGFAACGSAASVSAVPAVPAGPGVPPGQNPSGPAPGSSPPSPARTRTPPANVRPVKLPRHTGFGPGGSMRATGTSAVAMTFDDGPDPVYTPQLLDLLKRQKVKATFCLVGYRARDYPTLVRRIAAEGHTLCNHSWQHRMDLGKQDDDVILKDLRDTNSAIRKAVPGARIKYFRAPGGYFDAHLVGLAKRLEMRSIYWSVDTRDWQKSLYGTGTPMIDHIVWTVQTYVRQGSIILAHDLKKPDTIAAFKILIPWLKRHFRLIALPTA